MFALDASVDSGRAPEAEVRTGDASTQGGENVPAGCAAGHFYGGQAVIDGVMMRGKKAWSLAVRQESGAVVSRSFLVDDPSAKHRVLAWPTVRGIVGMWDSLALGMRALNLSANLSLEGSASDEEGPPPQLGVREMAITVVIALVVAVGLFVVLPLVVARAFGTALSNPVLFNLVEGVVRILIFLGYVVVISLLPDLRRVFQYHGAGHKTINAFEDGRPLDAAEARGDFTLHPRCGAAFLLVVMVVAILVFSLVGKPPLFWLVISRLLGIPVVAGLSYEVIRYAGRHRGGLLARVVLWPGLALQRLTTREPSEEQVQVAVAALKEVLRVEAGGDPFAGAAVGAGS